MKQQILLGLSVLMMAGVVSASDYDGTATGHDASNRSYACGNARTGIPYGSVQVGGCYCDDKEENGIWTCYVNYREKSSSNRSSSSSSSSYSSGSSSYSSPSYTPSYNSSGRFTPTQIPQRNPYVLSGQR